MINTLISKISKSYIFYQQSKELVMYKQSPKKRKLSRENFFQKKLNDIMNQNAQQEKETVNF